MIYNLRSLLLRMAPRWTEDMNIIFVKLYREHECLWDQFNELYKNKFARECALSDIAIKMNIEGFGSSEVNRKIKSLRATYHSEIAKLVSSEKSGCGTGDIYTSTLKWFDEMKHIMVTRTLKRKTDSKMVPLNPAPRLKRKSESLEGDGVASVICEVDDYLTEQGRDDDQPQAESSPSNTTATENDPPDNIPKRFKPRSKIQQIAEPARELKQLAQCISNSSMCENEFDIFGKHVASQLKQLKVEHAVMAIGEINNILMQKRLMSLLVNTNKNCATPSTSSCQSDAEVSPIYKRQC